jgi:hypothetical protein
MYTVWAPDSVEKFPSDFLALEKMNQQSQQVNMDFWSK